MTFVKYDTWHGWLEYRDGNLYYYGNVLYGEELGEPHKKYAKWIKCQSWHELYELTGYCPANLYASPSMGNTKDWWIRDDGFDICGDAHDVALYLYGIDTPVAEEWLEEMGWVKIREDAFWCRERKMSGYYKNVTPEQYKKLESLADLFDIYPENILEWNVTYT